MGLRKLVFPCLLVMAGCIMVLFPGIMPGQSDNARPADHNVPSLTAIDPTYGDYSSTLQEMKETSDLIMIGSPVSVSEQREYGMISNVEVYSVLKGPQIKRIRLYQLGGITEDNELIEQDGKALSCKNPMERSAIKIRPCAVN